VILFHNSGGPNMLVGIILSVLSLLKARRTSTELGWNTKGIICLDGFRIENKSLDTQAPIKLDLSPRQIGGTDSQFKGLGFGDGYAVPITAILDDHNRNGHLIWTSLEHTTGPLSLIHVPLTEQVCFSCSYYGQTLY
jgi:hypothetical protein